MKARLLIRRLLAVLVIAGLVAAPLITPATAKASTMASVTAMEPTDSMDCCPGEPKSKNCQGCPLVAICVLKIVKADPLTTAIPLRLPIEADHSMIDDAPSYGLARPPPDHPPRS